MMQGACISFDDDIFNKGFWLLGTVYFSVNGGFSRTHLLMNAIEIERLGLDCGVL